MGTLLLAQAIRAFSALLFRTLRVEFRNFPAELPRSCVVVFWHGSMLFSWWLFRKKNAAALTSQSDDGRLLAMLLRRWGYEVIRGSSSRGAKEAMEAMRSAVRSGKRLLVTPDGPRGPYHEMKIGALRVAQTCGVAFYTLTVRFQKYWQLRSWDRFEIPKPMTRCIVELSEPLIIPNLEETRLEQFRKRSEVRMNDRYDELGHW